MTMQQASANSSRRGRRSTTMGGMPVNDMPWWRWRSNVRSALHMLSDPAFQQECWLAGRRRIRRRDRRRLPPRRGHLAGQLVRREVRRHDLPGLAGGRARGRRRAAGAADHAPGGRRTPRSPRTWSTRRGRRRCGRRGRRTSGWPRTTARTRTRRRAPWTCWRIMLRSGCEAACRGRCAGCRGRCDGGTAADVPVLGAMSQSAPRTHCCRSPGTAADEQSASSTSSPSRARTSRASCTPCPATCS